MPKRVDFQAKPVFLVLFLAVAMGWSSCGKDTITMFDCTGISPSYAVDIKPILNASCALSGCHDAYSPNAGYDFSSYNSASSGSQSGRFLGAIQQKRGYLAMPNGLPKLSDNNIKLLTCWVQNGSPK
ncbi:MAG: hypothetical protein IPP15_08535 [Saprospiraceae bacterium]|uniref:Cytochrome C Planctomycete-type domain-containing protein n=1 Tax=Candidatus Opimibacter skivensis TaxID=2982028 RepID=A0A9D7SSU8_9BACT|nr:hypothetical protein [Candidatus Opimibacter skivensis]